MGEIVQGIFSSLRQAKQALDALDDAGFNRVEVGAPLDSTGRPEDQGPRGSTLITLYADEGEQAAEIMRRHGAARISRVEADSNTAIPGSRVPGRECLEDQPSSADVSMVTEENTAGAYPGWEPGGPGVTGLPPQEHEDGAIIPNDPEE